MKLIIHTLIALVALGTGGIANAVPIQFDIFGTVDSADPATANVFGLAPGDSISGSAFIPDANLLGEQTYTPDAGLLTLSFNIGNVSFNETQDLGFGDFPTLTLVDGKLAGLNFLVLDTQYLFSAFDGTWTASFFAEDGSMEALAGTFAASSVSVPEPDAFLLFTAGILILTFARRRRLLQ